uniref:Uncharacterized protein n=1 Tax=Anguilla anguilla TaxID=7936 RepID=A0A0E9XCJ8_ANGAN
MCYIMSGKGGLYIQYKPPGSEQQLQRGLSAIGQLLQHQIEKQSHRTLHRVDRLIKTCLMC